MSHISEGGPRAMKPAQTVARTPRIRIPKVMSSSVSESDLMRLEAREPERKVNGWSMADGH